MLGLSWPSSIRRELGFSGADGQWILNGYALTFGGLLLLCCRAGDLYGRRRIFLAGLALFGAASLLGVLAPSPALFVAARFLQGVGGAALVPASLSLLTTVFPGGEERNRAVGIYGATAAVVSSNGAGGGEALRLELFLCVVITLPVVLLGTSNDVARQKSSVRSSQVPLPLLDGREGL